MLHSMDTFTTALVRAIQAAGIGLPTLALQSGTDKAQLSRFRAGKRSLTLTTADKLLGPLGFTVKLVRRRGRKAKGA